MVEQLRELPRPPVFDEGRLHCDPDPLAPEHCSIESLKFKYPSWWPKDYRFSWPAKDHKVPADTPLHPSVIQRYQAEAVLQAGVNKPYRPGVLREHREISALELAADESGSN